MCHSDAGRQPTSIRSPNGSPRSAPRLDRHRGDRDDTSLAESTIGLDQTEPIPATAWPTLEEAELATLD